MASKCQLKFAANLSTLFDEEDFYARFQIASSRGFKVVEAQLLYDYDVAKLTKAQQASGLEVVLINSPIKPKIELFRGDCFGIACVPGQEVEFMTSIHQAITYANALGCHKVHIMAGLIQESFEIDELRQIYIENLKVAAEMLEEHNIMALIEPICPEVKNNYFLSSFDTAIDVINEVGSDNLKLLLDFYHLYMLGTDPEVGIEKYLKHAGHIQVSQAPNRNEVFADGAIDYDTVFKALSAKGYRGHIGLEYKPNDSTKDFKWIEKYGSF